MLCSGRLALSALLTITLAACCSERWNLTEPGMKAVSTARSGPVNLLVDYNKCEMSAGTVALMERAKLILGDEEKALVDYQARVERAITGEERSALITKRDTLLDGMISQVDQLRKVILHIAPKGATSQIAVVYTATSVTAVKEVPVITARFAYVTSLGPTETPAGILVKEVTPRHALSGLVDAMERFAVEQGALDSETKKRLSVE
jgi:hypothetical protein